MNNWMQHTRSAIGRGLIWAAAWFGAGFLLARVSSLDGDLPFAIVFTPFGFVAGLTFFAILVTVESRYGCERMPLSHFWGWGAVSGLLLSGIVAAVAALEGETLSDEVLVLGPLFALASTACVAGWLAVASRAARRELPGSGE
ncbi:MAG: hypothetical protein V4751_03050 [Pseudomonadota bacterium]